MISGTRSLFVWVEMMVDSRIKSVDELESVSTLGSGIG